MRKQDLERLQQPYEADESDHSRFARSLGIDVPHVRALERTVMNDLDPKAFGIGWWTTYPALGDKRRVLAGDYLVVSIASIETNLTEAQLHLLDLLEVWEKQNAQMADSVVVDAHTGKPQIRVPPRMSPADDLNDAISSLHVAGFFRAINSALDCLGAAIIGVAGLNLPIVTSDFDKAKTNLTSKAKIAGDPRQTLGTKLNDLIAQAGPNGWLTWVTKFRHTLLHRARRLQQGELVRRDPVLHGPRGEAILRADVVPHLPSEPARSDIDAFRDSAVEQYLGEHASETIHGALESTVFLIDGGAEALSKLWAQRRANPTLIEQPVEQWKKTDIPDAIGFAGYSSGRAGVNVAVSNESLIRRLKCAAIAIGDSHKWNTFT